MVTAGEACRPILRSTPTRGKGRAGRAPLRGATRELRAMVWKSEGWDFDLPPDTAEVLGHLA